MVVAANEVKEKEGTSDIGVSVDGTWQKRGFASLNGDVIAISIPNFKVLDVETMFRPCKACASKSWMLKLCLGPVKHVRQSPGC